MDIDADGLIDHGSLLLPTPATRLCLLISGIGVLRVS